jgi:hypothetical protein
MHKYKRVINRQVMKKPLYYTKADLEKLQKNLPSNIKRADSRGYGCSDCGAYGMGVSAAFSHSCSGYYKLIKRRASDPGPDIGSFFCKASGRYC